MHKLLCIYKKLKQQQQQRGTQVERRMSEISLSSCRSVHARQLYNNYSLSLCIHTSIRVIVWEASKHIKNIKFISLITAHHTYIHFFGGGDFFLFFLKSYTHDEKSRGRKIFQSSHIGELSPRLFSQPPGLSFYA